MALGFLGLTVALKLEKNRTGSTGASVKYQHFSRAVSNKPEVV
jgi:hypothetical protein